MYNTHLEFHSQSDDRPICFSPAGCCSRPQCRTTEQWSVYLIALAHPVCILTRLHRRLVKSDPVDGPVMVCKTVYTRSDCRCDGQRNCRRDRRDRHADWSRRLSPQRSLHVYTALLYAYPVAWSHFICRLTETSVWVQCTCSTRRSYTAAVRCAQTHGNRADGREFDGISEANIRLWRRQKEPGGITAVKNAAAWASCCISRAGTSAGWIVEKVILCIIRTPNFTVTFLENKCVLYPRFYGIQEMSR